MSNLQSIAPSILAGMLDQIAIDTQPIFRPYLIEAARRLQQMPVYGGAVAIPDDLRRNASAEELVALLTAQNHQLQTALQTLIDAHTT